MSARNPARIAVTALALCLAVAMLGGGAWYLVWYWRTGGVVGGRGGALTPEETAAVATSAVGGRQAVPGFSLLRKGSISGGRVNWIVTAGPFEMHISQPGNTVAYDYHYSVRRGGAYSGEDLKLINFAAELTTSPVMAREAGVSGDVIQKLRDIGPGLYNEPLKLSDDLAGPCEELWEKYVLVARGPDHVAVATQLIEGVHDACSKAMSAEQTELQGTLARIREIVPAEREKEYRESIDRFNKARLARLASRPSSMPAGNSSAATKP